MFVSPRHMLGVAGKQPNGSQSYLVVTCYSCIYTKLSATTSCFICKLKPPQNRSNYLCNYCCCGEEMSSINPGKLNITITLHEFETNGVSVGIWSACCESGPAPCCQGRLPKGWKLQTGLRSRAGWFRVLERLVMSNINIQRSTDLIGQFSRLMELYFGSRFAPKLGLCTRKKEVTLQRRYNDPPAHWPSKFISADFIVH